MVHITTSEGCKANCKPVQPTGDYLPFLLESGVAVALAMAQEGALGSIWELEMTQCIDYSIGLLRAMSYGVVMLAQLENT